jgi:hypothetical protein
MRIFRPILATCMLLLAAAPAFAINVPPLPTGTCALDVAQDADHSALLNMHVATQTEADMKALFAECAELDNLRLGRYPFLSRYGDLLVQKAPLPAGMTRTQVIDAIAAASGLAGAVSSQMLQAPDTSMRGRPDRLSPPSYHGVLKKSDAMVILGSEQRHLVSGKKQYAAAAVSAITVVGNQLVVANFFAPMADDKTFPKLTATAESYLASLLAANP